MSSVETSIHTDRNIDFFLESVILAPASNKLLRKRFLKPNTIGLIPPGGYSGNINYSIKSKMWLVYREQTDGYTILHATNGREYKPPERLNLIVDGFCDETRTVYKFVGCLFHGHNFLHFRDVTTLGGAP
jgi:hypothetical protein